MLSTSFMLVCWSTWITSCTLTWSTSYLFFYLNYDDVLKIRMSAHPMLISPRHTSWRLNSLMTILWITPRISLRSSRYILRALSQYLEIHNEFSTCLHGPSLGKLGLNTWFHRNLDLEPYMLNSSLEIKLSRS